MFLEKMLKEAKKENKILKLSIGDNGFESAQLKSESNPLSTYKVKEINYEGKFTDFMDYLSKEDFSKEEVIEHCKLYFKEFSQRHKEIVSDFKNK